MLNHLYSLGTTQPPMLLYSECMFLGFRPQNLIAQSQSGTGKTAAFALAMLSRVDTAQKVTQVSKHPCLLLDLYHGVVWTLVNL